MSVINGVVKAPITIEELYKLFGVSPSQSGGKYDVAYICSNQHKQINMWAKFKPENVGGVGLLTFALRKGNNFGLKVAASYNSKSDFITAVKNGTFKPGWAYVPPSSGAYKRLSDFDGYDRNATSPFGTLQSYKGILSSDTTYSLVIPCTEPVDSEGSISISDMQNVNANYSNWYFGILLYNTSRQLMATSSKTIGSSTDWQVDFGFVATGNAGTYTGIPFLSSKPYTLSGSEPSGVTIVGIGSSGVKVELVTTTAVYVPYVTCMYPDPLSNKVTYTATIQNTGGTAVTLTNVVLQIAQSVNGSNPMTLVSFGSVSVQAGKTWVKTGTATVSYSGVASNVYNFCRLTYTGGGTAWVNFEDPEDI